MDAKAGSRFVLCKKQKQLFRDEVQISWQISFNLHYNQFRAFFINFHFNHPLTGSLANSEDPYEISQNSAFHQGLNCSLLQIKMNRK